MYVVTAQVSTDGENQNLRQLYVWVKQNNGEKMDAFVATESGGNVKNLHTSKVLLLGAGAVLTVYTYNAQDAGHNVTIEGDNSTARTFLSLVRVGAY